MGRNRGRDSFERPDYRRRDRDYRDRYSFRDRDRDRDRDRLERCPMCERCGCGDGGRRGRRRSGSFSRSHSRACSSLERSRERERKRRKMQAECIRRAGGFQKLADSEGKEPVRLFWDGFQWVAKTGHSTALQNDPALMNSTRKLRRLYFGNLPLQAGLTEQMFQEMVWKEMAARNYCNDPNTNPVLCVWFAKDKGNYGFVEFASVKETENALQMDGMQCLGVQLKVSRPNDYSTATQQQSQAMALMGLQSAQLLQQQVRALGGVTSRVIKFGQIVKQSDLGEDETYDDLLEDIRDECEKHGRITFAAIIAPERQGELPHEVGDVFLEFESSAAAEQCIRNMAGRKYLGRPIDIACFEESLFEHLRPLLKNAVPT